MESQVDIPIDMYRHTMARQCRGGQSRRTTGKILFIRTDWIIPSSTHTQWLH